MGEFYNPDKLYKGGSRNNSLINKKGNYILFYTTK